MDAINTRGLRLVLEILGFLGILTGMLSITAGIDNNPQTSFSSFAIVLALIGVGFTFVVGWMRARADRTPPKAAVVAERPKPKPRHEESFQVAEIARATENALEAMRPEDRKDHVKVYYAILRELRDNPPQ